MNNLAVRQLTEVVGIVDGTISGLKLMTIRTLSSGEVKTYKVVNGYYYNENTPDSLIRVLDGLARNDVRCRFFLGDQETGRDWAEEYDTMGTIGRSCGETKIPLLISSSRSLGGGALLTHCIVKVVASKGGQVLWQHPSYQKPEFVIRQRGEEGFAENIDEEYVASVYRIEDGKEVMHANFRTFAKAQGYVAFLKGDTNSKAYGLKVVKN